MAGDEVDAFVQWLVRPIGITGIQLLSACVLSLMMGLLLTWIASPSHSRPNESAVRLGQNEKIEANPTIPRDQKQEEEEADDEDDDDSEDSEPEGKEKKAPLSKSDASGTEWKLVLLIRSDLEMTKGKVAAQCCHATLAAYLKMQTRDPVGLKRWERHGQAKITLKCPTEEEMLSLQSKAREVGLVAESIRDAGRTQIAAGSRTVLAIGPGPKSLIDQVSGHLKLY